VKLASKGPGDQEEMLLEKRPPIAKLKSMIHATRESTSRALTELEKQGLIEKSGGKSLKVRMPPKPVS
ncbi:MAG: helix-turn-helix domain-containing protein, partial [Pseudomonadota bacterium]